MGVCMWGTMPLSLIVQYMTELHADMTLVDIQKANPQLKEILFEHGIPWDHDRLKAHETLGEICAAHHLSDRTVAEIVKMLNVIP